jgi:hypothetical protein
MTEQTDNLRETIRARYAAAALRVADRSTTGDERGSYVRCIAGALSMSKYRNGLRRGDEGNRTPNPCLAKVGATTGSDLENRRNDIE